MIVMYKADVVTTTGETKPIKIILDKDVPRFRGKMFLTIERYVRYECQSRGIDIKKLQRPRFIRINRDKMDVLHPNMGASIVFNGNHSVLHDD